MPAAKSAKLILRKPGEEGASRVSTGSLATGVTEESEATGESAPTTTGMDAVVLAEGMPET
ncbi:hypothetical protein GCM10010329_04310 [Streptomyces spiroverticillatus]|uniref:Uncharacterized protein n=1 Tax=Streptomyces finlayi TaxID=67296 RepID=A0A918WSR3_9ACTN|nr:hypothetical protein GCM10010329_04310 [Streptomyces spiroverticillatus]GHC78686.1 hypothetical protein GCM10010334_04290 [Streptomyces finlayi]